jgi:hypothetical protein
MIYSELRETPVRSRRYGEGGDGAKGLLVANIFTRIACSANCFTVSMYAKLFGRHFGSSDSVRYLLEGDVAPIVRTAMIWFFVDTER